MKLESITIDTSFAYSVMVAPGSPRHASGVGIQMPGRGSIPQRKLSSMCECRNGRQLNGGRGKRFAEHFSFYSQAPIRVS